MVVYASVLINVLRIERLDILYAFTREILTTDMVRKEVSAKSVAQKVVFDKEVSECRIGIRTVVSPLEFDLYLKLLDDERLGAGESSAIAIATVGNYFVAMDDKRAIERTSHLSPSVTVVTTKDIMIKAIKKRILTVLEADTIKKEWSTHHRFRLSFETFESLIR